MAICCGDTMASQRSIPITWPSGGKGTLGYPTEWYKNIFTGPNLTSKKDRRKKKKKEGLEERKEDVCGSRSGKLRYNEQLALPSQKEWKSGHLQRSLTSRIRGQRDQNLKQHKEVYQ